MATWPRAPVCPCVAGCECARVGLVRARSGFYASAPGRVSESPPLARPQRVQSQVYAHPHPHYHIQGSGCCNVGLVSIVRILELPLLHWRTAFQAQGCQTPQRVFVNSRTHPQRPAHSFHTTLCSTGALSAPWAVKHIHTNRVGQQPPALAALSSSLVHPLPAPLRHAPHLTQHPRLQMIPERLHLGQERGHPRCPPGAPPAASALVASVLARRAPMTSGA